MLHVPSDLFFFVGNCWLEQKVTREIFTTVCLIHGIS